MSEIKGLDQIFPKKSPEESAKSNFKLWVAAGVVAVVAAGYALVAPGSAKETSTPTASTSAVTTPALPSAASAPVTKSTVKPKQAEAPSHKAQIAAITEDRKSAKKVEKRTEVAAQAAPEVKAAVKSRGRSCDCETAETNLPAVCPDGACRQCKATCGIPGN